MNNIKLCVYYKDLIIIEYNTKFQYIYVNTFKNTNLSLS